MPRYPDFFMRHSVLPPGVSDPTDRTPWEDAILRGLRDGKEAAQAGAFWAAGDDSGEADSVAVYASDEDAEDPDADAVWLESPNLRPPDDVEGSGDASAAGADTIAQYLPSHLHGADWGIYFDGPAFWTHVRQTEAELSPSAASVTSAVVVRDVFERVLAHERTHFAGEILGTGVVQRRWRQIRARGPGAQRRRQLRRALTRGAVVRSTAMASAASACEYPCRVAKTVNASRRTNAPMWPACIPPPRSENR
jgi:hypothetical protein